MNFSPLAKKRALGLIFFIMLMDVVGISMLFPVATYIVQRYSQDALMVTLLNVFYAGAQFIGAPILGQLGDRFGRRPVLLASTLGSAIGYVIFGFANSLPMLFFARVIDGFTGGNMSTASSYLADVSTREELTKNFSLIGLAWGVGLAVGPALGAIFGQIDLMLPSFVAAVLYLISMVLGYFWLPESLAPERRVTTPITLSHLNPLVAIGEMAAKPGMKTLMVVLCIFNFAFSGIGAVEAKFMIQRFGAELWQTGLRLVIIGIILIWVRNRLIPWARSKYDNRLIAVGAFFLQAIGVFLMFINPDFILFFLITIVTTIACGVIFPMLTALTSTRVSAYEQGQLMGVTTALASLANIFGPLWAGVVYDKVMPGAPYWMGALLFALAGLILLIPAKHAQETAQ